jgi:Glyoxalase-like domain
VRFGLSIVLLACGVMCAEELKVDHVTVAGRDLRAMQRALEDAGIKSEYGGPHSNHATEMALTSFPDGSYLELIAIQPRADPKALAAHEWRKSLEGNGGPTAWAVRPADLPGEVARLRKAGISASEPKKNGRKRPDGVQLEWETAQIGPGNGTFFPFLIHDFTPRERRAYPSGKPTTTEWTGIARVVLAVKDLEEAIGNFQRAYALPAPEREENRDLDANMAWFRNTPVVLASPRTSQSWLSDHIRRFGESACAFVIGTNHLVDHVETRWFGRPVMWADFNRLGWRLGFEGR